MITKAQIERLKRENPQQLYALLSANTDVREVLIILENLGHLPPGFDLACVLPFVQHTNKDIRLWAVKNLGKIANHEHLDLLRQVADDPQEDSMVRREAVHPHPQSPDFMKNTVVQGDVRAVLKDVPDESIHLTFTSPPYYNARDYSIYVSYQAYLDFLSEVFSEVHRATKAGRFLIVNTSPVIVPRISRAHASTRYPIPFDLHARLVQQGWEFIDDIVWLKPESSVKNRNAGFLQHRKPLAYKPNATTEYLMVYRKQTEKLLD